MTKHPVYSFGYHGQKLDSFVARVRELGAVVVDTRLKPVSRDPSWNKSRLLAALPAAYRWIEDLGNLNYKGNGPTAYKDFERGMRTLREVVWHAPVVVLCICRDVNQCHRRRILGTLGLEGHEIIDLTAAGETTV